MKGFTFHINKLSVNKLRRLRAWVRICIFLLLFTESMAGYLIWSFQLNNSEFDSTYVAHNSQLTAMQNAVKVKSTYLLNIFKGPFKKKEDPKRYSIAFNLFVDHYLLDLPNRRGYTFASALGYDYKRTYKFSHHYDILHPPQ